MGTIRSQPEPVIEHLVKGHKCKQFTYLIGKGESRFHPSPSSFKGWQLKGKHFFLETASFGSFLWALILWKGKVFFFSLLLNFIVIIVNIVIIVTATFFGWSETGWRQLYELPLIPTQAFSGARVDIKYLKNQKLSLSTVIWISKLNSMYSNFDV